MAFASKGNGLWATLLSVEIHFFFAAINYYLALVKVKLAFKPLSAYRPRNLAALDLLTKLKLLCSNPPKSRVHRILKLSYNFYWYKIVYYRKGKKATKNTKYLLTTKKSCLS